MSESAAISTVVASLKTVRDQYQEQLQNIPQYATFLRVQQLTEISPAALGIAAGTDGFSTAHDVVAALGFARDKFREHLATVPEYRALLSINKLIADLDVAEPEAETSVREAPVAEAPAAEAPVTETVSAAEATAVAAEQPVQESAPLPGVLGHGSYEGAVDEALADMSSLSALSAAAQPAFLEAAAAAAEAPAVETPLIETLIVETRIVETTVGGIAFETYPNVIPEQTTADAETPAENPGAERAA